MLSVIPHLLIVIPLLYVSVRGTLYTYRHMYKGRSVVIAHQFVCVYKYIYNRFAY